MRMRRPVDAILVSQRRIRWPEADFERAKYLVKSEKPAAEIKYAAWDDFQTPLWVRPHSIYRMKRCQAIGSRWTQKPGEISARAR